VFPIDFHRRPYNSVTHYRATLWLYTVSQKNCATVIFWITSWNIGRL